MERNPQIQAFVDYIKDKNNIEPDFVDASDHPGRCRCALCKKWWKTVGADEDGYYGPFTKEEIDA